MKTRQKFLNCFLCLSLILSLRQAEANTAVQRTTNSPSAAFSAYLKETGNQSFAEAYVQLSQKMELSSKYVEICLENIYLGRSDEDQCMTALKELTQRPLNPVGREILYSFLSKTEKGAGSKKEFFHNLKTGLLETDSDLATVEHQSPKKKNIEISKAFASLETKAWKKALAKVIQIEESQLLINGKAIKNLTTWNPPPGVYQWALVTNTHEPLMRLGTFLQFAAESLKNLQPFAENCKSLSDHEVKKFGLLQVEVFASAKCIAKDSIVKNLKPQHLTALPSSPPLKLGQTHWIWPTLALVGVGLAVGLKGKNVQVTGVAFR